MDTYQFIAELVRITAGLAWPIAIVLVAKVVRDILNEGDAAKQKPQSKEIVPRDDRPRSAHPPAPTYPPRG